MKSTRFLFALACCLAATVTVRADLYSYTTIPGVFSTGVDNSGQALPVGAVDPHWTISASPNGAMSARATDVFFMWIGNTASSAWINGSGSTANSAPGTYTYSLTFSLAGFDPSTAVIAGEWTSDNRSAIYLNGVDTGMTNDPPWEFTRFKNFTLNTGFLAGQNTLSFVVTQDPQTGGNPTGLQVNILSAEAVVPEPSSWVLGSIGCLLWIVEQTHRKCTR